MNIWSMFRNAVAVCAVGLLPAIGWAQQHEGDVEPYLIFQGGGVFQLGVDPEGHVPIDAITGYKIFEGDFGDLSGGPFSTDDPGFNNVEGGFAPGSLLGAIGIGSLSYWNGSAWVGATPNGEQVFFEDALGSTSVFSSSGVVNGSGIIGQFDASGNLHEHLDFSVTTGATAGAYSITLQLFSQTSPSDTTPLYANSAPFTLIFNRGLSEALFEAAIDARVAPVPLPAGLWLLFSGLAGLGIVSRRRDAAIPA